MGPVRKAEEPSGQDCRGSCLACSLLNHLSRDPAEVQAYSSYQHQGVLPGSGEHSHFLFTNINPGHSIQALDGSGARDASPCLSLQVGPGSPHLVGSPMLWLPAPRACRAGVDLPKGLCTSSHVGTVEHWEGRGPLPALAAT